MGEDQEVLKHMCKLCNKSFPSGRSLGGHMRSHVMNSAEHDQAKKLHKKKLSSLISNGTGSATNGSNSGDVGYGLRENPKKTCKFKDSSHEDTFLLDKVCKECGKGFQSIKALFGHMKCHSDKVSHNSTTTATLEGDSWTSANQKLVLDSQSDNENFAPNRKKRSRRGAKRYMATITTTNTTASSSISINATQNNNASTSVFENEQEQEEIAMCLMMLSRDVSQWSGLSVGEASDNNSAFVEANLVKFSAKIGGKNSVCNGGIVKIKKLSPRKLNSTVLDIGDLKSKKIGASEVPGNGSEVKKVETQGGDFLGNTKVEMKTLKIKKLSTRKLNSTVLDIGDLKSKKIGASEVPGNGSEVKKVETQGGDFLGNTKVEMKTLSKENEFDDKDDQLVSSKSNSRKRKGALNLLGPELGIGCSEELVYGTNDVQELYKDSHDPKKSKFECTTCNKAFHSYQALGGHRAGHKKLRGCSGSRIGCWENDIENTEPIDQEMILMTGFFEKTAEPSALGSKKMMSKGEHECPICFRVFSSGQALGVHKRSHLIAEDKSTQNSSIVIQEPIREIRDFLDLNMPAPVEEELSTISSTSVIGFKPWWIEGNHKHESFLGLLSS